MCCRHAHRLAFADGNQSVAAPLDPLQLSLKHSTPHGSHCPSFHMSALPLTFEALGVDINKLGISVVERGGKTKLPVFMRVAEALEIPYVVLADEDVHEIKADWSEQRRKQEEAENAKHRRNKDIENACLKGKLFWLSPNFEAVLGLPVPFLNRIVEEWPLTGLSKSSALNGAA